MFDINVLADMLLKREPFAWDSSRAVSLASEGKVDGVLCSHAVTTLYYLLRKQLGQATSSKLVDELLSVMDVAVQPKSVFRAAQRSGSFDFEDAVTAATAVAHGCHAVVTRDKDGFKDTPIATMTPSAVCERYYGSI